MKGAAIQSVKAFTCGASNITNHQVSVQFFYFQVESCSKKNDKMNFSKKSHFLKNVSKFKARYKKTMRFMQCIAQVGVRLCKKKILKICNIEANIEYFAFLNCCNLTFSQIEIIIKFFKNFVKEDLNLIQLALYEGFS